MNASKDMDTIVIIFLLIGFDHFIDNDPEHHNVDQYLLIKGDGGIII